MPGRQTSLPHTPSGKSQPNGCKNYHWEKFQPRSVSSAKGSTTPVLSIGSGYARHSSSNSVRSVV
ncbi:hypothetical protein EVA_17679 [gut metagenome]|uniref:Uncharacterized protein n=1 Tax=gut metagenome TaxID=749906 RepID=J9FIF5_9ZZZZ